MPTRNGELQITTPKLGQEISGKLFRPHTFETVGAISLDTGAVAVAIKLFPMAGDPDFKEPVVVLISEENVEVFIRAIRIALGGVAADVRKGGSS
jgi:hypothetical protein